jgi:predicted SnoaL-like aldol condensation-catalyzing enzyme
VIALVDRVNRAVGEQAVAQLYAGPPGEVVIAGAGLGKRALLAVLTKGLDRPRWRDLCDRFQRSTEGVVSGRDALREFVAQVFAHQHGERRRFRSDLLTDGRRVTWEYPRQSPDGDQMDIVEVMEIDHGLIRAHRVYWGWKGVGMLLRGGHGR